MEAREFRTFECEWPEIARWLKGALARRGVPFSSIDDVVQETGCRLFGMWDRVDQTRSTRALALTIATNFVWDERNRRRWPEPVEELPETATGNDVEAAGIARFELGRVKRALGDMAPSQRQALLAEIGDADAPEISQAALKMLRHRARRRLTVILDSASASCLLAGVKLRNLSFRIQDSVRRYATAMEAPAGTVVAACAAAAVTLSATAIASPTPEVRNVPAAPSAASIVVAAERTDRDGWIHVQQAERVAQQPRATEPQGSVEEQPEGLNVSSETPTGGTAGVYWHPENEGDESIDPPACTVGQADTEEVSFSCRVDAGEEEFTVGAQVELQP